MIDILTFVGTFGLFLTLFLLFLRFIPLIAIAEVKSVIPQGDPDHPLSKIKETDDAIVIAPSPSPAEPAGAPYGLLAEYETAADIKRAAKQVRNAGYRRWDVFTPFPIHGLDAAMGLRHSRVGWFAFIGGVIGFCTGMIMIWFMNAYDYPLVVGGKPLFSPVYAFPISFELTILFGAFGALFGMLFVNRLPRWHNPLFNSERFTRVTHDRFFILVECADPQYAASRTRELLAATGSQHIEMVEA